MSRFKILVSQRRAYRFNRYTVGKCYSYMTRRMESKFFIDSRIYPELEIIMDEPEVKNILKEIGI